MLLLFSVGGAGDFIMLVCGDWINCYTVRPLDCSCFVGVMNRPADAFGGCDDDAAMFELK